MSCQACLKRVILIQARNRLEIPWSEATRERQMTLVGLAEATTLLGAKVGDLATLGGSRSTGSEAPLAAVTIDRLVSAA